MDLFDYMRSNTMEKEAPLASRLRPRTLEEVSQEIGRTRERVRQIQNQALSKLKSMLADEADFTND